MKYNLRSIMTRAWRNYRKGGILFAEALHRAWLSAKQEPLNSATIEAAKAEAGIIEECETWAGWRKKGYEVVHGAKAIFKAVLLYGSKGDGATYTASFFARSQVEALPEAE